MLLSEFAVKQNSTIRFYTLKFNANIKVSHLKTCKLSQTFYSGGTVNILNY